MKSIEILNPEFWKKMEEIKNGESEMNHEYMYDFVAYLSMGFFGLTMEFELERKDYWLSLSTPNWIVILVQNMLDLTLSPEDAIAAFIKQPDLDDQWEGRADDVLIELILHHCIEYMSLLTPLLDNKKTRSSFFYVASEFRITEYFKYDSFDLVAPFADCAEEMELFELDLYAYLIYRQSPEKAIPVLEKLRQSVPNFSLQGSMQPYKKAFYEELDIYIRELKLSKVED